MGNSSHNSPAPPSVKKLYALPKFTNDFLKVPVVEAPILDIQSSGLLSQDGLGSIKDSWDKRIEHSLCWTYDASSLSVGASATASIVARASIVWIKKLIDLIPPDDSRVQEGLSRILKANSFVADATLDSLVFTSRAMAASMYASVAESVASRQQVKTDGSSVPLHRGKTLWPTLGEHLSGD